MVKNKKEVVKNIDYMIGRHYDLSHQKILTDEEKREIRGWGIKIEILKMGGLDGMEFKEYLSLTNRDWGDKAQIEFTEGKREYDNRTEKEILTDENKTKN